MQHATQQLGKTSELRKVKRDIARVRTVATELSTAAAKSSGKA
jgi:large subunit ribosomal protein L29